MNRSFTFGLLSLISVLLLIGIYKSFNGCACKSRISYSDVDINASIHLDSLFRPIEISEIEAVNSDWRQFNSVSDHFEIVQEFKYGARKTFLIKHAVNQQTHYAVIICPIKMDTTQKYPLLLFANGLNQTDPTVNLSQHTEIKYLTSHLLDYFILVPSFRGQAIAFSNERYCSDGFFGDAFDGATDDALRFLHLCQQIFTSVDKKRMSAYGISRGGTVALLAGIRDTSLNAIISQAGPVDFLQKDVYKRYGKQFKYQFLSHPLSMREIRKKVIKSSPLHFIKDYSKPLFLLHGKNDMVVPLSNAQAIVDQLKGKSNFQYELINAGHSFNRLDQIVEWLKKYN